MENCSRDLSHQIRSLHEHERKAVKRVMTEKRARYCTVVQCLNPIINEEFGMLSEVCQIEDVMHKLMNITSTPGVLPKSDEEVYKYRNVKRHLVSSFYYFGVCKFVNSNFFLFISFQSRFAHLK
jgi:hypothetical protein